jgi:hypothetical protein
MTEPRLRIARHLRHREQERMEMQTEVLYTRDGEIIMAETGPRSGGRTRGAHPETMHPLHEEMIPALSHPCEPDPTLYTCPRCRSVWPNAILAWWHYWHQTCLPVR